MKKEIKEAKTFDELLDIKYGKQGEKKRDKFEINAQRFVIREMLMVGMKLI